MDFGAPGSAGTSRVDGDMCRAAATTLVEPLHRRRHGVRRIGPDQQDDVGRRDVSQRERQAPVDAERAGSRRGGRRHAEPAVVVDLGGVQSDPGELAELVGLLVGQTTAAEAAHRVRTVVLLGAPHGMDDPIERVVPGGGFEWRVAPVADQGRRQPLRVVEQLGCVPTLAAQPAPVGREIVLGCQVDPVGSDTQCDAALQRAVRAVRQRLVAIHTITVRLPRFSAVVCRLQVICRCGPARGASVSLRAIEPTGDDACVNLTQLSTSELARYRHDLRGEYEALQAQGLTLDLTRGKPSAEQLDLSEPLLELPGAGKHVASDGADTRNYGGLRGLVELREIFSGLLGVPVEQLIAFGNSSLELMHECLVHAVLFGVPGSVQPWGMGTGTALLCPVPGYDRHFSVCEKMRIEMITVPMNATGPNMDEVERLVAADARIKGIWCVPKYSNPSGIRYSEQTAGRLAQMRTAAPDFRIFWDDAYAVHHLTEVRHETADI